MMKMVENVNVEPWRLESPLLDLDRNDKIRPKQTFHKTLWIPDCGFVFNKNFYGLGSGPNCGDRGHQLCLFSLSRDATSH